jgi:hypothetical protein
LYRTGRRSARHPRGFYRHDVVVLIDLTSLMGDHAPAIAAFADAQFATLP